MDHLDFDYYRAREQQELALASASTNPAVAGIHRDLAARYAALVRSRSAEVEYLYRGDGQSPDLTDPEREASVSRRR